ncbi:TIGR04283 family arsenosugar biosynthesis glycosyltransferase, partial [Desulfobacterales bacterium HSG17]|nr:TIGR04283 family arsenosugar biosynthesis glycosyltransferase [Desulfobacterales bacterium HSG17]
HKGVIKVSSPKGRGIQMNAGAKQATGRILLFLHADTFLPVNGLELICYSLSKNNIVAGAFDLGINSEIKYYRIIEKTASIRSRLTGVPYGDQAIFVKKDYFFSIKGFQEIPIMEDVDFMGRIKKHRRKIITLPLKVSTSSRRWETDGVLCGTLRNWLLMILYLVGTSPEKLAVFYKYKPIKKNCIMKNCKE